MRPFLELLRRDLKLALRDGAAIGTALGFYVVVVTMLPLGLGPDLALLSRIAPGVLWIALLLAALLSLGRLFERDYEDGTLDILATGPLPLELIAATKCMAHWVSTVLPLSIMAPVLGLILNLELGNYPALLITLLCGTPAVSFLGGICAALTLRGRRSGLLVALLVLPLYIPTLIFGIAAMGGMGTSSPLLVLLAISLGSMAAAPFAAAAALRMQLG